jgi:hypothetical protein
MHQLIVNKTPFSNLKCPLILILITHGRIFVIVCLMVFNATFNNISVISWPSVLLVEKIDLLQVTQTLSQYWMHVLTYEVAHCKTETLYLRNNLHLNKGGHDHMVVGFTTTFAISAYHH